MIFLDVTSTTEELGKNAGSDVTSGKVTYPSLLGLEQAKKQLDYHHQLAKNAISFIEKEQSLLLKLAEFIVNRKY